MYEMLVGLELSDVEVYGLYRKAMMPILKQYGGRFGYDFTVSEVLISQGDSAINRVFTIAFPSQSKADAFFANSDYLKVKQKYFNASVVNTSIIASYDKPE